MHPSQLEIQREVETLRDIRRRSTAGGPGALVHDPDLPNASSLSSSQHNYRDANGLAADDNSSSDHDDGSDSGDPSSLFWVPARLHPEIAPAEFREFIKEHARTPVDGSSTLDRSFSTSSLGIGRKKSMLKREYKPSANDGVENEGQSVPLQRNRSRLLANPGPQFTIRDLQRLDELAEEASKSDDPTKLRKVLRRSFSLNVSPSVVDKMDDTSEFDDDADAPIIIPRPGQALRRSARTKIRKPGQTTGGAHVFNTRSRRLSGKRAATLESSDKSSSDHGARISFDDVTTDEPASIPRPESYSEESFIYDSYVREEPEDTITAAPILITPQTSTSHPPDFDFGPTPALPPPLQYPTPQHPYLSPPPAPITPRTPSPEAPSSEEPARFVPSRSPDIYSIQQPSSPSPSERSETRKDKDKKGLFGKWGGDKGNKKAAKEKEQREKEKEKDSASFFGSLFGGKKKQDEYTSNGLGHGSGRETAAALLGNSKSSKNQQSPSPTPQGGPYARYPIHVERAIYRLSHIKLANPRRPLYEQVLISNLMFWYLGVINKAQNGNVQGHGQGQQQEATNATNTNTEKEYREKDRKEQEEREKAEREKLEGGKERELDREKELKKDTKRGPLTKTAQAGTPGVRKAEMPVRGPQYEAQRRVMEQEYNYKPPNAALEASSGSSNWTTLGPSQHYSAPASLVQPQPQQANSYYFPSGNPPPAAQMQHQMPRPRSPGRPGPAQLPPGAMPPVASDQTQVWNSSSPAAHRAASSSPPPAGYSKIPRGSRSPPPHNRYSPAPERPASGNSMKLAGRSLSANAVALPSSNGKLRKGMSAHAVMTGTGIYQPQQSEEDVPLAVWQQQQRRG